MTLMLFCFLFIYLLAMAWVFIGLMRLPHFSLGKPTSQTSFSVLIPFRNESKNISRLLASLKRLEYAPENFEVIFIDDASDDNSSKLIDEKLKNSHIRYRIVQNERYSKSPKKDAISLGVKLAINKWIVTTDADCALPRLWLLYFNQFLKQHNSKMICGPVLYATDDSLVQQFQFWDGLSLQAAALAGFGWNSPFLCNGANLAFEKDVFFEINGFTGNNHLATGDDIFLLEKIKTYYPGQVHFLKNSDASVTTQPMKGMKALISQRIRWASKTAKNKSTMAILIGLMVLLGNIGFIISLAYCFIYPMDASVYASYLLVKLVTDTLILGFTACFFRKSMLKIGLVPSNLTYPFVMVWVVLNSWSGQYEWKGRTFRK